MPGDDEKAAPALEPDTGAAEPAETAPVLAAPVDLVGPPAALIHIEKTLGDAYRKEIDQEENIWRTLPFFTATLALQLAALFQLTDKLAPLNTLVGWAMATILGATAALTLVVLLVLHETIRGRDFIYPAPEPDMLNYALGLIEDEKTARSGEPSALHYLQKSLAEQYALATHHNRQLNKARERARVTAGQMMIYALILTLFLVAISFFTYSPPKPPGDPANNVNSIGEAAPAGGLSPIGHGEPTEQERAIPPPGQPAPASETPPNAGGDQGMGPQTRPEGERRGSGEEQ